MTASDTGAPAIRRFATNLRRGDAGQAPHEVSRADTSSVSGATDAGFTRGSSVAFVVAIVGNMLPILASFVRLGLDHWVPAGDLAVMELSVRDVGTRATPLVGAWSRFGWRHPGPLPFYLLAGPYRLAAGHPWGLEAGALLINAVAIVGTLILLREHGARAVLVGGIGLLLLQFGLTDNFLRNEWNVYLAAFPFVLLLVAAWTSYGGSTAAIAGVPIAATFVMQAHAGYLAISAPAVALWVLAVRRGWQRREVRRATITATSVAVILWLPVALDALLNNGGNAGRIVRWALAGHDKGAGFGVAAHIIGDAGSLRLPFVDGLHATVGLEVSRTSMGLAPGILFGAMVMLLAIVWRRDRDLRVLTLMLLATWAVAVPASARIAGPLYPHLFLWSLPLGMLSWYAVLLMAGAAVRHRPRLLRSGAMVVVVLAVATAGLGLTAGARVLRSGGPNADNARVIEAFTAATHREIRRGSVVIVDRTDDYIGRGVIQAGMMARLQAIGVTARAPRRASSTYVDNVAGNTGIFTPRELGVTTKHTVVVLVAGRETLLEPPGRLLAQDDPLTRAQQRRWLREYGDLRRLLIASHHPDLVSWLTTPFGGIGEYELGSVLAARASELHDLMGLNELGQPQLLWETRVAR